jgi:hypothetical protein
VWPSSTFATFHRNLLHSRPSLQGELQTLGDEVACSFEKSGDANPDRRTDRQTAPHFQKTCMPSNTAAESLNLANIMLNPLPANVENMVSSE